MPPRSRPRAVVAFGAASAGYNASLLLTGTDAILAGLSTSAAQVVDESYVVSPVSNYFFSMASAIVLALIITVVAELVLARIAERGAEHEEIPEDVRVDSSGISAEQVRALKWAGVTALAFFAAYMLALFLPGSVFVGDDGVLDSPLLTDIVVPIALLFGFSGLVYGLLTRSITSPSDVPVMMGKGIVSLGPVIVLFFAAAQFVAYFRWSNIGSILAIKGSEVLEAWDLPPLVMFFGLVLLVAALNFFITSGSAQYALMAPVIVPMFMLIEVQPEVTQMLFRMGDSPTNVISPMSPYFALALGYLQQYNRKAGIGTLFSLTLPISIAVLRGWFLFFCVWYLFGLPLGPGIPIR